MRACVSLDNFSQDLCKFYCQLDYWRELAIISGLTLPELSDRNLNLSPEEQWNQAIAERDRFAAIWRLEANNTGVDLTGVDPISADTPSESVGTSE